MLTPSQDKLVCKCTHTVGIAMPIFMQTENILPYWCTQVHSLYAQASSLLQDSDVCLMPLGHFWKFLRYCTMRGRIHVVDVHLHDQVKETKLKEIQTMFPPKPLSVYRDHSIPSSQRTASQRQHGFQNHEQLQFLQISGIICKKAIVSFEFSQNMPSQMQNVSLFIGLKSTQSFIQHVRLGDCLVLSSEDMNMQEFF